MISSDNKPLIKFYNQLGKLIESAVTGTKDGSKQVSTPVIPNIKDLNTSDVKISESKINDIRQYITSEAKLLIFGDYDAESRSFIELLDVFRDNLPNKFVFIVINKILKSISEINSLETVLRTSQNLLKDNKIAQNIIETAKTTTENYKKIINSVFDFQRKAIEHVKDNQEIEPKLFTSNPILNDNSIKVYCPLIYDTKLSAMEDRWYYLSSLKETKYTAEKKKHTLQIDTIFNDVVNNIKGLLKGKKKDAQYFILGEIVKTQDFDTLKYSFLNDYENKDYPVTADDLTAAICYILLKKEYILEYEEQFYDSSKIKQLRQSISEFIQSEYKNMQIKLIGNNKEFNDLLSENAAKAFPKYVLSAAKKMEQETLSLEILEDPKKEYFQKRILTLYELINKASDWFIGFQPNLQPYSDIIGRDLKILTQLREELDRKQDDFLYYLDSLIEQNTRSELDDKVDSKITDLENLLKDYEKHTSELILKEIPEAKQISEILDDFQINFNNINAEVSKLFKEYQSKANFNVYSSLKHWEEKFNELKNRVKFVVSALFMSFFDKFRDVIEKEQSFFNMVSNIPLKAAELPLSFSLDILLPEKLTEKQLRERLHTLDRKIKEIDKLKEMHEIERKKYQDFLEKILSERNEITAQQCVVCHKDVNLIDDHYIKCEFCGRLSHYLCSAWWLEKHNSCPVCNNQYTVPNSSMYENDFYEDENEDDSSNEE